MRLESWHAVGAVTAVSFAVVLAVAPRETWLTTATLSLALGVSAAAMMGIAALLGSRWRWVESIFGGLDRVYIAHKWLAVWALVFASVHFVFRAGMEEWSAASILELPRPTMRFVRQLSLVALMTIVVLALNRNIPYHRWRLWHKLSGPLFLIVVLHWLSIRSPIALNDPAGVWLAATSVLGVAGAAYKLALYPFLASHAEYRVVNVASSGSALHLELEPVGRGVRFEAGQFAFLRIKHDGLREPHPFTIAGRASETEHVHFVIRSLGDYTQRLMHEAKPGMYADVYAPYGRFRRPENGRREIWIAGGVGVTPFIAWLTDEAAKDLDKATFFYFFTPGREFPSADFMKDLAARRGTRLTPMPTSVKSPEFREAFAAIIREAGAENVDVSFCGPRGLLLEIRSLMREHGVPESRLRHEYFEFR